MALVSSVLCVGKAHFCVFEFPSVLTVDLVTCWVCFAFGDGTTFVLSHVYYYHYSFRTPKARSIFGLHRQRRCQKFRLGSD